MSELRDLYQEVIFDHYRRPRNCHGLADANHKAEGYNPLCGDRITLYLRIEDDVVKEASFEGVGCAIATASASLMTEALKGKTEAEAEALFGRFHDMVTTPTAGPAVASELGKLAVLSGVREFPARVKCATLAWHTLHAALHDERRPVSTE
ncbi:SUF system NifU family Fe-S cluster assembly protein [Trinickia violacea]|uniref:SUF system NifU family Fe-S cluster assembly protein n=1 Tax=Trinickia violacea TaxID=2571746 RepID=A0A4P8IQF9_9BURK|nr:SUF system NifU family Fe-S cluster assembly protein [Trinickia violacea]QCP50247.1 SUF system NifU family Fe-S cluster assembly protein [Trinickia violacea]